MKISAGILPFRRKDGKIEVFLVHMGGPFWAKKDEGAWSIPKGLVEEGEDLLQTAKREFYEETGERADGDFIDLGEAKSASKKLHIFALEAPNLSTHIHSNTFTMEWPPKSGKMQEFPEVDRAAWFDIEEAKRKIVKSQRIFLERLQRYVEKR